ncbi:TetR/AcrR family transcriptional regulator [Paenactinomyces guangxiensis]|uniref:TetR/AcrR family transcriptional regulator n=1 Tax=Paenactinomyces guangxiensis TaxID=1490290 RepID=A0A7W1WNE3_9BACL|nr:TetR/AcrR family transcriptional regulator [Paenactinomyces guangxiensis]MBA4493089.1 TetR/AcrR family transcriptional regulator [Paenactinomyces guangxiensis]MBH8590061.1 TetR/AcrR family transcriptional regulator [Paenactinomyces guangxiensis]
MKNLTNRQLQALETKNKLIDAALLVFAKKGYSATTTKDIAREAGVTDGLIYHYFKSKEDLLWAVIDKHTLNHELSKIAADAGTNEPVETILIRMIHSLFDLLHEKAGLIVMFFGESQRNAAVRERLAQLIQQGTQIFYQLLSERMDAQELYLKIAIRNLLTSLVMYFLTDDRYNNDVNQRKEYIKTTVHQFLKMFN